MEVWHVNSAAENFLGKAKAELIEQRLSDLA